MLRARLVADRGIPAVLAVPVRAVEPAGQPAETGQPAEPCVALGPPLSAEISAFLADRRHTGRAGLLEVLPRPLGTPRRLLLVGIGTGSEGDWRAAGAAVARAARQDESVTVALPAGVPPAGLRGLTEGALLAAYRYRLGADAEDAAPRLCEVVLAVDGLAPAGEPGAYEDAVRVARAVAEATILARDLVNTPSATKSPAWLAERMAAAAADRPGLTVSVRGPDDLAAEGFGGVLAVGGGSARAPRLVELSWRPDHAATHVVLVGKGITFDTGGIVIKPREGMKLMRKDMAGAAAVAAAAVGAAALRLPVRVTALAPLAENMVSGSAYRPGDVVRHYGGLTSEIRNTDAEGRLVLADALAYAVDRLAPDVLVDLATLTGANAVALGKRTAALYSDNDELAAALAEAAAAAGERIWRMPLPDDYVPSLASDVADLNNAPDGAGSVTAALYLREFAGGARDGWAHIDMSAPAWADGPDAELTKGATGWGVRTLLRWLASLG
ncbi:MAG: leucyl aminopeptidase [Micromonosporaceae bacterium]